MSKAGGDVSIVPSTRGPAADFGGVASGDYLELANVSVSGMPLTLCAWANLQSVAAEQNVLALEERASSHFYRIVITSSLGSARAQSYDGGFSSANGAALTAGKWHHLTAVFASATSRHIYIDGVLSASNTTSRSPLPVTHLAVSFISLATAQKATGQISDARLYNRALSAAEIWQLYDPLTRWELYEPVAPPRFWLAPPAAGGGIEGTLSVTLSPATLSATGEVNLAGTTAVTLEAAGLSAAGTVAIEGEAVATLEDASLSATATNDLTASTDATLDDATLSATATLGNEGELSGTLDDASLEATGVSTAVTTGTLTATLADATVSATGQLYITGETGVTLDDATVDAAGALLIDGTAGVTLEDATASAAGTMDISGAVGATLEDVSLGSAGGLAIVGTLGLTLADVILVATGSEETGDSVVRYVVLAGEFDTAVALVGEFNTAVSLAGEYQKTITLVGEL